MAPRQKRPRLASLMLRAAWSIRLKLLLSAVILFSVGFGAGWLKAAGYKSGEMSTPATAPTPVEKIKFVPVEKTKLVSTPVCGPPGLTKDDIRLACKDGWLTSDEVRLFGVDVTPSGYPCKLPEDEERALQRDEDSNVTAATDTRSQSRLCASNAISADAIRLACKNEKISAAFARLLGIDAHTLGSAFYSYGCELAPQELRALERDEAAAAKPR
jgi:hypothetical protein